MENNAMICVHSIQQYEDNPPETIELTTEGRIWEENGKLYFSYQESELTGLEGTQTVFALEPDCIVLERRGRITSRMEFRVGQSNKSLYDSAGLGSMMICVVTEQIENRMELSGGSLRVVYTIEIEDTGIGTVAYDITVTGR